MEPIKGLHHVTALAGNPQGNVDFYAGVLGLRLVKKTVNFDDPGTYHLYYGDEVGHPGTILTFFPWPQAHRGRRGTGQTTAVAFAAPPGSLDAWMDHLARRAVDFSDVEVRFGERLLSFDDPDGLRIEIVEHAPASEWSYWKGGSIPSAQALRGFHSVTLTESAMERTVDLLTGTMNFQPAGVDGNRHRVSAGSAGRGSIVDVVAAPGLSKGSIAVGTIHHIAFRCASDEDQLAWRARIAAAGLEVTPVMDRNYFHSIYFDEPGGVIFEIATDPPGFTADESPAELGSSLKLPSWLEPERPRLEQSLVPLHLPRETAV